MNPLAADPLAELRDIHLPDPISAWPPAPGWWILAALILLACVVIVVWIARRIHQRQYRREALTALEQYYTQWQLADTNPENTQRFVAEVNTLLKRCACQTFPSKNCGGLFGSAWLEFLDRTGKPRSFSEGAGKILATLPYQAAASQADNSIDCQTLYELAKRWIKQHKASKTTGEANA